MSHLRLSFLLGTQRAQSHQCSQTCPPLHKPNLSHSPSRSSGTQQPSWPRPHSMGFCLGTPGHRASLTSGEAEQCGYSALPMHAQHNQEPEVRARSSPAIVTCACRRAVTQSTLVSEGFYSSLPAPGHSLFMNPHSPSRHCVIYSWSSLPVPGTQLLKSSPSLKHSVFLYTDGLLDCGWEPTGSFRIGLVTWKSLGHSQPLGSTGAKG